jgi:hypothetical protein
MKTLLSIVLLLITITAYGNPPIKKNQKIYVSKRSVRTDSVHRAYRRSNRELRELGFELDLTNTKAGRHYLVQKSYHSRLYQVYVKVRRKRIVVEIYAFVDGNYKNRWSDLDKLEENMNQLYDAIRYRVVENQSLPPVSCPFVWAMKRDLNYNDTYKY